MTSEQLRHILRASAGRTEETEFIVIGSQALLASHPDAPKVLVKSMEGDTYPKYAPEKSILIDGAIGEATQFHKEFGYYAHGVDPDTATLPKDWEKRLVHFPVNDSRGSMAYCLEKHDIAFSKLVAGREKDFEYVKNLLKYGLVNRGKIQRLIAEESRPEVQKKLQRNWTITTSRRAAEQKRGLARPQI